VHWSQGDVGKGFASLGVRLGIPTSGMLIGAAIGAGLNAGNTGWFSGPGWGAFFGGGLGLAIGLGAGVIVAPIVDATVLGWRDVPARKVGRRVVPTFAPAPRGGTVGFSATF